MKDTNFVTDRIRFLFRSQKLAVLSTDDHGQPYASLVAFCGFDDLRRILFATARSTRKFENIKTNRKVALLINSSQNKDSDFHEAVALTVTGRAEEAQGAEKRKYLKVFLKKHPYLEDFVSSPTCALMCVMTAHYYVVENFQTVTELHI